MENSAIVDHYIRTNLRPRHVALRCRWVVSNRQVATVKNICRRKMLKIMPVASAKPRRQLLVSAVGGLTIPRLCCSHFSDVAVL